MKKNLLFLDGMRALMAINVILCHFVCVYFPEMYFPEKVGTLNLFATTPLNVLVNGNVAVVFFFALTGFLVGRSVFIEKNNDEVKQAEFDAKKKYMNFGSGFALVGSALVIPVIGLVPNITADFIMDFGQNLFSVGLMDHKVHYFAFHNMKGTLISVAIGVILYYALVRICLMGKNPEGKEEYMNYWPKWMDLENLIYRPVFIAFIPFICGIIFIT